MRCGVRTLRCSARTAALRREVAAVLPDTPLPARGSTRGCPVSATTPQATFLVGLTPVSSSAPWRRVAGSHPIAASTSGVRGLIYGK